MQLLWKIVWKFLKKLNTELLYNPAISLPWIYFKESKSGTWSNICIPMFIAALLTIVECPLMNEWSNKIWYIHTREYDAVLKRKKILTQSRIWMNLKDITVSEINESQKDRYFVFPLIWGSLHRQIYRDKK